MRRFSFVLLSACLLASLAFLSVPAKAGDYYNEDGYRHRHSGNVSYSSSCCYRKVVRHVRSVRYVRVNEERPYYRNSYYDRPYRNGYYERPYRSSTYYNPPRRYVSDGYVSRRYIDDDDYVNGGYYNGNGRYYSSGAYDAGHTSYAQSCTRRSVRVADGRGGWVWSSKRVCY